MRCDSQGRVELVTLMQVDGFLYTGTAVGMKSFEDFVESTFIVGSKKKNKFKFFGVKVIQRPDKGIVLSQEDDLEGLSPIQLSVSRSKQSREPVTDIEKKRYQSLIGSMLWIGTHTAPFLKYITSMLAQKVSELLVKDLKAANSLPNFAQTMAAVITYLKPNDKLSTILTYTDASMNGPQEACIVFKLYGRSKKSPMHPIM